MKKLTYQDVKERIENEGYELLSDSYKNSRTKIKLKCKQGHIFEKTLGSFKKGENCPKCSKINASKKISLTYNEVKDYIEKEGYELLSKEYINNKTKLKLKCPLGHEFDMMFNSFKNGYRCSKCSKTKKLTYNEVKKYIEKEGYKLLSDTYINNRTKLELKCPKGHIFYMNFNNFKDSGCRCPECANSKGETKIKTLLNNLNIKYIHQYYFDECRVRRKLPFDFYLPDYNCCIEFDGRQHYEIVYAFGGLDGFIETKIRDTVKTEYCKNNNIKLIRIPYWELNKIEDIIKELINNE